MQGNRNPIQIFGFIMSREILDVNNVLDLIQIMNKSFAVCRDIITILQDIFKHQKSGKILIAVHALEYFVKNCNVHFHNAANRQSFQKRLLSLLNRVRGKTNLIKQLNSNTDNWCRIQAKVLYIIQLWYDAFILEESKFLHIINTYKVLRKQNITFPPRSKNQKNLMFVQTQSPIFDNIQQIAHEDQKKFNKKLTSLGMSHLRKKMQHNINYVQRPQSFVPKSSPLYQHQINNLPKQINIDQISQKIAIIQSTQFSIQTLKTIEQIKKAIQFGKVKPNQQQYWKEIKLAAQNLIQEWESKNSQLIQNQEQKYLQRKLGMMGMGNNDHNNNSNNNSNQHKYKNQENHQQQQKDLFDIVDNNNYNSQMRPNNNNQYNPNKQIDLFDAFDQISQTPQDKYTIKQSSMIYPSTPIQTKKETDLLDLL